LNDEERNKIQALFPAMPQDVLNLWLGPGVDKYGWPFQSVSDSITDSEWSGFLLGRSLSFWSQVQWSLLALPLDPAIFHPDTISRIDWIIGNCAFGKETPTANLQNTKQRFWTATSFIRENSAMPQPLVVFFDECDFIILDGNHRLAAAVFLGLDKNFSFAAWVAFPN
jgi:hypothetical protein